MFNTQLQTWFYDTLITPQGAAVAVSHGSKVYVAGGINNTAIGVTPNISIYDTLTGMWTADSLSVGRFGHAGAAVGDLIMFAGGYTNTGNYPTTDVVDIYNTSTDTWSTAQLSQKRGNINACLLYTSPSPRDGLLSRMPSSA